jgi:deazaflavin-dependent oxidoreductase (nitroreductase family)
MPEVRALNTEQFCYLTTTGRVSGQPREIEIWFGIRGRTLYMLSGGRDQSNWVKNIKKDPSVSVRIGRRTFRGAGRIVTDRKEDLAARKLLAGKYASSSDDLSEWGRDALPVAVDLETGL